MNQYLVDVEVSGALSDDFISLIPEQREHINQLMAEGTLSSFSLSLDRTRVWITINAETEDEVKEVIESMPLSEYMKANIYELAFFNIAGNGLPAISLN